MDYQLTETPAPGVEQDAKHDKVLAQFKRHFKASTTAYRDWRDEARRLYDAVAGHQWDEADKAVLDDEGRPTVTFNLMGKFLDVVVGLQINNRQDIRFFPREPGDARKDDLMTSVVEWARDQCDMADEETDAFYDSALVGLGFVECYLDEEREDSPMPAGQRRDPLEIFPDPAARRKNLADARFIIRVKWMEPDEFEEAFPDQPLPESGGALFGEGDDSPLSLIETPHDYPDVGEQHSAVEGSRRKKISVFDYQYVVREPAFTVTAEGLGQQTFDGAAWAAMETRLKTAGVPFEVTERRRPVYYRAFIAGAQVIEVGLSPWQRGFTYHAITGKRDRNRGTWYGIGRSLIDPNKWTNKFFSSILYVLMTSAKNGYFYEQNTFTNPKDAEANIARPGSNVEVQRGALTEGKILPKAQAQYPQGLDRLMEFTLNALPQVSGLNVEILGMTDRVQAGVVEAQRKQSAMSIIAWLFDAMRRYYRAIGRQLADYVVQYVPEQTIVRVTGDGKMQYVPLVKDGLSRTFDLIVDEAPTSINQKERTWLALESLAPKLLQAGITIPREVLDYAPLPQDLIEKWKASLDDPNAEQKQKAQQDAFMAEIRKTIAEALRAEADAALKQAQTVKTEAETGVVMAGTDSNPQITT